MNTTPQIITEILAEKPHLTSGWIYIQRIIVFFGFLSPINSFINGFGRIMVAFVQFLFSIVLTPRPSIAYYKSLRQNDKQSPSGPIGTIPVLAEQSPSGPMAAKPPIGTIPLLAEQSHFNYTVGSYQMSQIVVPLHPILNYYMGFWIWSREFCSYLLLHYSFCLFILALIGRVKLKFTFFDESLGEPLVLFYYLLFLIVIFLSLLHYVFDHEVFLMLDKCVTIFKIYYGVAFVRNLIITKSVLSASCTNLLFTFVI